MKRIFGFCVALLIGFSPTVWPKEPANVPYSVPGGASSTVDGLLRKPVNGANGQAILLLHHAGGFDFGTTTQYAELFAAKGFTTLELKMFDNPRNRPAPNAIQAMAAGGLRYLARMPGIQPERVSAIGLSMGAFLTVIGTSSWFYEHHQLGDLRFHRLAALYPVCWILSESLKGSPTGLVSFDWMPPDYLQRFAGVPLLILAAGKDDYDGRNPQACPDFAKAIPSAEQAKKTEVKVYPEATHGWDHGRTYEFMVWGACADRKNCRNRNVSSPETVARGKEDLVTFFMAP